jgi:hypothetical protein
MADDYEAQQRYIENLKKANQEFADLNKGLDSTAKSLLSNARNAKERKLAERALLEQYKLEMTQTKKKFGQDSAQYQFQRRTFAQNMRNTRSYNRVLNSNVGGLTKMRMAFGHVGLALALFNKTVLGKVVGSVFDLGKRFVDAGEKIENFSDITKSFDGIPILGKGMSALAQSADFNVGVFKQLAQTGATFESSIINLRNAAHDARMPILDFVDMVSKNSEVMAQLFGTVDAGVKRMSQFQSALRTVTQEQFAQFGLNLEETSEYFQTYLMLERARGRLVLGTTDEEIKRSSAYIKNLITLSKLSGEEIDVIDKRNRELAANGVLQAQLLQLGPAQRDAINGTIASFGGADTMIGKLITQVVAFGQATETDTALLNELSQGQLVPAIQALTAGSIDIVTFRNMVGKATQAGFLSDFNQALSRASIGLGGEFATITNEVTRLQKTVAENIEQELKDRDTTTESLVSLRDSLKVAKAGAESLTTGAMEFTTGSIGLLDKAIKSLGQSKLDGNVLNRAAMATTMAFDPNNRALRITEDEPPENSLVYKIQNMPFQVGGAGDLSGEAAHYDVGLDSGTKKVMGQRFPDFGSGTNVRLHGTEAVVPKDSPMGNVISAVDALGTGSSTTNTTNTITNNTTPDNSQLTSSLSALRSVMENVDNTLAKSEKHLNMLVNTNMAVARNTGDTKKGLANISSSLV